MKRGIRKLPRLWRASRLLRRWYYARRNAYPDWRALLADRPELWASARSAAQDGPAVLLGSAIGSYTQAVTLESALAVALTLRGARVHTLLCDAALPACAECDASLYPDLGRFARTGPAADLCRDCHWPAASVYRSLGIVVHHYSQCITTAERAEAARIAATVPFDEIPEYRLHGLAIGEHAHAGALRFFASGSLEREAYREPVLRRYLEAALLTAFATRRLIRQQGFRSLTATQGIYVPWGIMGEVARQEGVRVVNWNVAYRKRRFIFSHGDTYHQTLMSEPRSAWESLTLTPAEEQQLMSYLGSRREGLFDWIVFHRPTVQDAAEIGLKIGLDPRRPAIGLLTNVSWDAQLHYPANAFPSMLDWLVRTCEYFATRQDLQLVIRVHPAEISGFPPSRQPILAELARAIPKLPPNIVVVPPESGLSTYTLMSLCNGVIIYGTKMGVELTSVGLPVIVAGEAWIRNKGITLDAATPQEYFALLDRLPFPQERSAQLLARARRYAYHFFFRRMIPLGFIEPNAGYPIYRLKLERLDALLPGATPGLDVICDGILEGSPFIFDEHRPKSAAAPPAYEPASVALPSGRARA